MEYSLQQVAYDFMLLLFWFFIARELHLHNKRVEKCKELKRLAKESGGVLVDWPSCSRYSGSLVWYFYVLVAMAMRWIGAIIALLLSLHITSTSKTFQQTFPTKISGK